MEKSNNDRSVLDHIQQLTEKEEGLYGKPDLSALITVSIPNFTGWGGANRAY